MSEIKLTKETIKALSSETRVKIMKNLNMRRKTVSELSLELNLSKSTVHEHLTMLLKEKLIEKKENDNKWVYYELTKKGKELIQENGTKILLLLSSIVFAVLGSFSILISFTGTHLQKLNAVKIKTDEAELFNATAGAYKSASPEVARTTTNMINTTPQTDVFFFVGVLFFIIAIALVFYFIKKKI